MTANLPLRAALPALAVTATMLVAGCGGDSGSTRADDTTTSASASATSGTAGTSGTSSSPPATDSSSPADSGSATSGSAIAVYDVGSTPQGLRLYREFRPSTGGSDAPTAAVQMLTDPPLDPDYRTLWPAGSLSAVTVTDGQIDVTVDASLAQAPSGMSAADAKLALQQVVYTVQAAAQQKLPVRFMSGDAPATTVLGVPTADPVAAGDFLDVLALVSVTTPEQGQTVSGGVLHATGVASSFEGTVPWEVLDSSGTKVADGSAQAAGYLDKLYPWKADVDVSGLAPGDYTFVAMTDDPSGGEGPGPTKDTKAFTIS